MNPLQYKILTGVLLILTSLLSLSELSAQSNPLNILLDYNTGLPVRYGGELSSAQVLVPSKYVKKKNEFRGVWVATIENIDFPQHTDIAGFKKDFINLVDHVKKAGFTALIFQVRPSNDAFYPSKYAPWSKYLAGREGLALANFDPLKFMIDETHKRGLEFHAWLNPYRVAGSTPLSQAAYLKTLSPSNFAVKNPDLLLTLKSETGKNRIILNPGEPGAIKYIVEVVNEIISKYDVDAIHMDDYFYPYEKIGNIDSATYARYKRAGLSLDDWRRNNVDALVQNVGAKIKAYNRARNKNIRFGISPFGIWANKTQPSQKNVKDAPPSHSAGSLTKGSQSYFQQHADTRRWVREEWIDYIAPQLYWSFSHNVAAYAALADWWADTVRGTGVDLYIGHDVSRLGVNPAWKDPNEIVNQLKYNCRRPEIKGSILFSYTRVFNPSNPTQSDGVKRVVGDLWKAKLP